ncbi:MAG TPA: alpha/beta hydrolase-fold protein [Pyrinomonadaceae bacterium]
MNVEVKEELKPRAISSGHRFAFILSRFLCAAASLCLLVNLAGSAGAQEAARGRIEYTKFQSESLGREVNCAISLPPSYDREAKRRYPVLIFLHGFNNSERDWEERGMQARLEELRASGKVGEFIIAMPYGARSFYLNGKDGTRYEDAIVKDFIPFVDKTYHTLGTPRARMIEGISMGGYGALMIAFKHSQMFAAVSAHSAALFEDLPKPPAAATDGRGTFRYQMASKLYGSPFDVQFFQDNNPLNLAKANAVKIKNLKIYFDVGEQDSYGFDAGNRQLDSTLTAAGIKHEFHLAPGEHGWAFLLSRSTEALAFDWNALRQ